MHHTDRKHFQFTIYKQRMVGLDGMENNGGGTRIAILSETIRHGLHQSAACQFVGIDIHLTKLTERTQVVDAAYVVVMNMSKQHGINFPEGLGEHLLAEVGARINQYSRILGFYQRGTTQPLVMRIFALTSAAGAAYGRHAYRCSCSQKSQLHEMGFRFQVSSFKFQVSGFRL